MEFHPGQLACLSLGHRDKQSSPLVMLLLVFRLWQETGELGENLQTPHGKAPRWESNPRPSCSSRQPETRSRSKWSTVSSWVPVPAGRPTAALRSLTLPAEQAQMLPAPEHIRTVQRNSLKALLLFFFFFLLFSKGRITEID